jgi:predicted ATPase
VLLAATTQKILRGSCAGVKTATWANLVDYAEGFGCSPTRRPGVQGKKFLHSIRLKNLLSYGSEGTELELEPLNVLIGANASGKSNLIDAISLLAAAPRDLLKPIREGGGTEEWLWKGPSTSAAVAELEVTLGDLEPLVAEPDFRYTLQFMKSSGRLRLVDESLANVVGPEPEPFSYYAFRCGRPVIQARLPEQEKRQAHPLKIEDLLLDQSVLSQFRGDAYPELTKVGEKFGQIRFFREWIFSRRGEIRSPQRVDLPDDFLLEDASNLALIVNDLQNRPETKSLLVEKLKALYEGLEDLTTKVQGGRIQIFVHERGLRAPVPMERLPDGTLHYLILLAILCHPEPPPLICLEEPELGLHPDVIPKVAELLVESAQHTQLIVTTHSDALVSALSDIPESVVVCERGDEGTSLTRLEPERLREWLVRYQLGEIWSMGEIGGNRW